MTLHLHMLQIPGYSMLYFFCDHPKFLYTLHLDFLNSFADWTSVTSFTWGSNLTFLWGVTVSQICASFARQRRWLVLQFLSFHGYRASAFLLPVKEQARSTSGQCRVRNGSPQDMLQGRLSTSVNASGESRLLLHICVVLERKRNLVNVLSLRFHRISILNLFILFYFAMIIYFKRVIQAPSESYDLLRYLIRPLLFSLHLDLKSLWLQVMIYPKGSVLACWHEEVTACVPGGLVCLVWRGQVPHGTHFGLIWEL